MSRPLRYQPDDGWTVYEVTTRTVQSRFLLRPSDRLNALVLGVLGRAQRLFRFRLHAFMFMSNHYGMLVGVPDAVELSALMCFVNGNIAREAGRLHAWREKFWRRRYRAIPVLDDESLVGRVRYIHSNGVKEGLISRPERWPGASSVAALCRGEPLHGVWVDRTAMYRAARRGDKVREADFTAHYTVELAPMPCWADRTEAERRALHRALVREVTEEACAENERRRRKPLGARAVRAVDPHDRPARSDRSPAPHCHTATPERRHVWMAAYRMFVAAYRDALDALRRCAAFRAFPRGGIAPGTALVGTGAAPPAPS